MNSNFILPENDNVNDFLESYWELPSEFYDSLLGTMDRNEYKNWLKKKYGNETLDEYSKKSMEAIIEQTDESWLNLFSYVFQKGLSDDVDPPTTMRSRETLRSLLKFLDTEKTPSSFIDLGSGDGKIAIGVGLYNDDVEKIYAIDNNPYAIHRTMRNIEKLDPKSQERVRNKLIPVNADYRCPLIRKGYRLPGKDEPKIVVAAHTFEGIEDLLRQADHLLDSNSRVIRYSQALSSMPGGGLTEVDEGFIRNWQDEERAYGEIYGIKFKVFDHSVYMPNQLLVGSTGIK